MQLLNRPPIFFAASIIISVVFSTFFCILILGKLHSARGNTARHLRVRDSIVIEVDCNQLSRSTIAELLQHGVICDGAVGLFRAAAAPNATGLSARDDVRTLTSPPPRGAIREPVPLVPEALGGSRKAVGGLATSLRPGAASKGNCPKALLHMVFHKTGTILSRSLYSLLRDTPVFLNHRVMTQAKAVNEAKALSAAHSRGGFFEVAGSSHSLTNEVLYGTQEFSCVGMFRDPYSMIVSGYSYHKKVERIKESWAHSPNFDPCTSRLNDVLRMGAFLYSEPAQMKAAAQRWQESCQALTKQAQGLWEAQRTGLPSGDGAMTYIQMLQVLPPQEGVFLETCRALINAHPWGGSDLLRMAFTYDQTRRRECCLNIFMEDFERSFTKTSRCLLDFWRIQDRSDMTLEQAVAKAQDFDVSGGQNVSLKLMNHKTGSSQSAEGKELIQLIKDDLVFGDILKRIASVLERPAMRKCS